MNSNNRDDYEFFQSNMMRDFLFSKRHILDRIKYKYQHLPYEELRIYINKINNGKRTQVIYYSGLYQSLKKLLNEEMEQIRKYIVPKYLEIIERRHQPINLNLKWNGKPVFAKRFEYGSICDNQQCRLSEGQYIRQKTQQATQTRRL